MQDVGVRFYTYAATMGMAMEAAAKAGLEFYVLDRPNPINGLTVEGPLLEPGLHHITAYFPVPVRHGLTLGELARLHADLDKVNVKLRVVPMQGWDRRLWYDETGLPWTKPSPNMPDLESATLYPGIGCFESTNLSAGRGTPLPFRWVGAPWLRARALLKRMRKARIPGVQFSLEEYVPEKETYKGQKCRGLRIDVTDRDQVRPLDIFVHLACALRDLQPGKFQPRWDETKLMLGTDKFRVLYQAGAKPGVIIDFFNAQARQFEGGRKPYLLY